jgi:capsular exopolysaccharide synthesis family protein
MRHLMLFAVAGLMIGVGLAVFLDYIDDTVKNPDDVRTIVPIPVLGNVGHHQVSQNGDPGALAYLPILEDSRSQPAEAFRTLRSNLLFSTVDQPRRSILLTSPTPGDGKSTCAANLGVALSQLGKRVVLVDTDLRKPILHRVFKCRRSPGLVDVLIQEEWEKALYETIQTTQVPLLEILSCGDSPPNPNEMLGSDKMGLVIGSLYEHYDYMVFDAPPLLTMSDAMVLAHRLDGVLMVARGGRTGRSALRRAADQLAAAGTGIVGVVLNDIDFRREHYYYYYSYGYHYARYQAYSEEGAKPPKKKRLSRQPARKSPLRRQLGLAEGKRKLSQFLRSVTNRTKPTRRS